ncbi:unnamed protein product, partial [Amoebophrya sp. A25]
YAKAQSTSVLEDLGSISHIFSDKTGTLTENLMLFSCLGLPNDIRDGAWYNNPGNHVDAKERASVSLHDIKRQLGQSQFEDRLDEQQQRQEEKRRRMAESSPSSSTRGGSPSPRST